MLIAIHVVPARQAHRLAGGQAVHAIDVAARQRHLDGRVVVDADAAGRDTVVRLLLLDRLLLAERRHQRLDLVGRVGASDRAEDSGAEVVGERIQVVVDCLILGVEAHRDLVLVELARLAEILTDRRRRHLVDDVVGAVVRVRANEDVHVVLVGALRALDVAVVRGHGHRPGGAARIRARAPSALLGLDRHVHAVDADVRHLVVAGLLLRLGRLGGVGKLVCDVRIQIRVRRR